MCNWRITVLLIIAYSGFIKPCAAVPIHINRAGVQNSPLNPQIQQQQQHQPYQQPSNNNNGAGHIHINIQTPKSQHQLPPHRSHTYNNQENNIQQERLPNNPSHIVHEATYNNAPHNNVEDSHKNTLPNYKPNSQFQNNAHRFNSGQIGAHEANVANIDGQWSSQPQQPQPQQPGANINMQGKEQLEPICTSAGCRDRNIHMNSFNQNHLNTPHEIQKQPVKHPYVSNAINTNEIHQPKHIYGSNSINTNEMKYPDNRMSPQGPFPRSSNHNPNPNTKLNPPGSSNNININNGNTHHGLRPLEIRDQDPIHTNRPLPPRPNSHSSSTAVIPPAPNNQSKGQKQQQTALMKIEYDIADKDERDTYETSIMDVVDEL